MSIPAEPAALPAKESLLAYLDKTQTKTETWFRNLGDEGLIGPDKMPQFSPNPLVGRAIYVLRHLQYHLGQIDAEMNRRGLQSAEWL